MTTSISIPEKYKVMSRDSKGSQLKYHMEDFWYKIDTIGCESDAEVITSIILSCSDIDSYVDYSKLRVNNRPACKSKSFLNENEMFISFEDLYYKRKHQSLTNDIRAFSSVESRYWFVLEQMQEFTGLYLRSYLDNNLALDLLTMNPDRHFNNLGVIVTESGYRRAPIFDNGQGFGANWSITHPGMSYKECCSALTAGTLSGSFADQYHCVKSHFMLDYSRLAKLLKESGIRSRCLLIADKQLRQYRKLFELTD